MDKINGLLDKIKFDSDGLVVAVVQDIENNEILMQAYMNKESFQKTIETGYAHYYSRSRKKLWLKGEESGHTQKVLELFLDCDGDAIIMKVQQIGPACHTGRRSCFYRELDKESWKTTLPIIEEPEKSYLPKFMVELYEIILDRIENSTPDKSYVKQLVTKGSEKINKKVIEEAYELAHAIDCQEGEERIASEGADLLFHFLVALGNKKISPIKILSVLKEREGLSGIEEKNSRKK